MIKLTSSVYTDVAAKAVWARLAALEDIQLWSEPALCSTCQGNDARGVGAERACELAGNLTIKAHWIEWDEGRSFKYDEVGIPLVKRASNYWSVYPEGEHQAFESGQGNAKHNAVQGSNSAALHCCR
ncbi:MAG: SRPBCC family protein [Gammaproteobacteria bacterium]